MTNYIASTTINFEGSRFYVRPGDILSYNSQHGGGSLAIFRNGQLVKVLRAESLVIEAFLKSRFISEVRPPAKPPEPSPREAPAQPVPQGAMPMDVPLTNDRPTGLKRLLPEYPSSPDPITPGTLADGYARTLLPELPPPVAKEAFMDHAYGKKGKKRPKPVPAGEIDYAVHPPDPPPSQVVGPDEDPPEPEHNRISEP